MYLTKFKTTLIVCNVIFFRMTFTDQTKCTQKDQVKNIEHFFYAFRILLTTILHNKNKPPNV